jgi:hypothetical protein
VGAVPRYGALNSAGTRNTALTALRILDAEPTQSLSSLEASRYVVTCRRTSKRASRFFKRGR